VEGRKDVQRGEIGAKSRGFLGESSAISEFYCLLDVEREKRREGGRRYIG